MRDRDLTNFILLLKIDNELILSLDDSLVLLEHLLSLFGLSLVIHLHVCSYIVQCVELFVEACDLVVLDNDQLVELVNLLLRVSLLPLVSLEHRK